jgi:phosphate/sulfate permease
MWSVVLSAVLGAAIATAFYVFYRRIVLKKKPQRLLSESFSIRSSL